MTWNLNCKSLNFDLWLEISAFVILLASARGEAWACEQEWAWLGAGVSEISKWFTCWLELWSRIDLRLDLRLASYKMWWLMTWDLLTWHSSVITYPGLCGSYLCSCKICIQRYEIIVTSYSANAFLLFYELLRNYLKMRRTCMYMWSSTRSLVEMEAGPNHQDHA